MQTILLKRGQCVGCTRSLAEADRSPFKNDEHRDLVVCICGRIYVYDKLINSYRRASFDEVK